MNGLGLTILSTPKVLWGWSWKNNVGGEIICGCLMSKIGKKNIILPKTLQSKLREPT